MTISAMCDYCGEHSNPYRMFQLIEPNSNQLLHFCDIKCLKNHINSLEEALDIVSELTKGD